MPARSRDLVTERSNPYLSHSHDIVQYSYSMHAATLLLLLILPQAGNVKNFVVSRIRQARLQ